MNALNIILALVRLALVVVVILVGCLIILPLSFLPLRFRGIRLPLWVCVLMARCFNKIFNVHFRYHNMAAMWQHRGFLFPTHCSYLDIIAMIHSMPVRFLAAVEVRRRPFIGWLAETIGSVFVTRANQSSRESARAEIVSSWRENPVVPIVIYPEGRLGPGNALHPFRYGAFQMAVQHSIPYLPVVLRYSNYDIAVWHGPQGESMLAAVWRHAKHFGPIIVEMTALDPVHPQPDDNPQQLALAAQTAMAEELGVPVLVESRS